MPSFVVHGLVPLLLLLAMRWVKPRVALAMLPFTFLPDLDFWLGVHRATTSNIFILLPGLILYLLWREEHPARIPYVGAASFYLASHLVMDLFVGGIVLFWPLWDRNFFWWILVQVNTTTGETNVTSEPGTHAGAPQVSEVFTWLSPIEVAMLVLTALTVAATLAYRHRAWIQRKLSGGDDG